MELCKATITSTRTAVDESAHEFTVYLVECSCTGAVPVTLASFRRYSEFRALDAKVNEAYFFCLFQIVCAFYHFNCLLFVNFKAYCLLVSKHMQLQNKYEGRYKTRPFPPKKVSLCGGHLFKCFFVLGFWIT